jgi:hypothetical protein
MSRRQKSPSNSGRALSANGRSLAKRSLWAGRCVATPFTLNHGGQLSYCIHAISSVVALRDCKNSVT